MSTKFNNNEKYIEERLKWLETAITADDTVEQAQFLDNIYSDGFKDGQDAIINDPAGAFDTTEGMTPEQNGIFTALLSLFITDCGLDRIEVCKKAQELLQLINED